MPDQATSRIARMVARKRLSEAQARAAIRLLATARCAMAGGGRRAGMLACAGTGGVAAINRRERQVIREIAARRLFQMWQSETRERGGNPGVAIDVLLLGHSLAAVDRRMKRRKGWARGEVRRGIEAFHDLLMRQAGDSKLDRAGRKEYQIG